MKIVASGMGSVVTAGYRWVYNRDGQGDVSKRGKEIVRDLTDKRA